MTIETSYPDVATIHAALDIAYRAQPVHNTQPWRWALARHRCTCSPTDTGWL